MEKKGKALASLDYFEEIDVSNIPKKLVEIVTEAFSI